MEAQAITSLHNIIPTILLIGLLWGLGGWFFMQVLGKELKDYIVFSLIVVVILMCILLFIDRDIQRLLFGYKVGW